MGFAVTSIIHRGKSCLVTSDAGGAKVGPAAESVLENSLG